MANGSANVAGNALRLLGENSESRETGIDVHQGSQWTRKAAPHPATEPEIHTDSDDSGHENIDNMVIIELNSKDGPVI